MAPTRAEIEVLAHELGFAHLRVARVGPTPHGDHFRGWVADGHHADMHWLDKDPDTRLDPRTREESVRSAIVLAVEHAHRAAPDPGGLTGRVARYAWGRDYHNLIGKRLRKLRRALRERGVRSWGGVDTAPILERSWAAAAGLGFSGKNSVQIWPASTSWMFLAVVFVDLELPADTPLPDHCGRCTRCLSSCPTDAFVGPRTLDARKCISYWTIESKLLPPRDLRAAFGRWIFGCDDCQEVCPHNTTPPPPVEQDFIGPNAWIDLPALLHTKDDALLERFRGTPIRRPGAEGLKRNAAIALGNSGSDAAIPALHLALQHPSDVVQGAALWALGRLHAIPSTPPRRMGPLASLEWDALLRGEVPPTKLGWVRPARSGKTEQST